MKKDYLITAKKKNCYFFIFALLFLFSKEINAQCAGTDNTVTICDKELDPTLQSYDLFAQLGGTPTIGGVWTSDDPVNISALIDTSNGILNLWTITVSDVHSFTYTNDTCGESAVITIELGPYAGKDNEDLSANTCTDNIDGNGNLGNETNLFSFINNDTPGLLVDTNGTWLAVGPNALAANNNISDFTFNAHGDGIEPGEYNFTYTVNSVSTCASKTAKLKLQVNEPPEPGTTLSFIVCEDDDLSIYQNLNLLDYIQDQDVDGFWTEDGTSQLSNVGTLIDTVINVEEIYNTHGIGNYNFTYNVNTKFGTCLDDFATVVISIVGINGEFLVEDYCDTGSLLIDILYENIFELNFSHDLEYEIHNTNTNELVYTGFINDISPITLDDLDDEDHRLQPQLPDPYTHFHEEILNSSPILIAGNYTISVKSMTDIQGLICDEFVINSTTFNVYKPEVSVIETCFDKEDIVMVDFSTYTDSNGNLINGDQTLTYTATHNGESHIITNTINFVDGNGIIPIDLQLWDVSPVDFGDINLTFDDSSFSSLSCIDYTFPFNIIPDIISLSINVANECNTTDVGTTISVPLLLNGEYEIFFEVKKLGIPNDEILVTQNYVTIGGSEIQNDITTLGEGDYVVTVQSSIKNNTNPCRNTNDLDVTITETFTIYETPEAPILEPAQSFCFSDFAPNGPTIAAINVTVNPIDNLTLTWYEDNSTTIALDPTTLLIHGENYYVSANDLSNNCDESLRSIVTVSVYQTSLVDTSNAVTEFCEIDNPTLADINVTTVNGGDLIWYADATIEDELTLDTSLVDGVSYFASERNVDCEGERTEIVASVIPNPLTINSNTFCASPADQINLLQATVSTNAGYDLLWYDSDQTTVITDMTTQLTQNTTYYVSSMHTASGCESERQPITVYITSPIKSNDLTPFFCMDDDATIAFLDATAENNGEIIWYDEFGTELTDINNTDLENGTSYFAVERVGNCESQRTEFAPIIIASPIPISAIENPICIIEEENIDASIKDLEAPNFVSTNSNFNLIWYNTSGVNINTDTLLEPGVVYFVASIHPASGCESERIPITVTITAPVISTNTSPVFCSDENQTLANLNADVNNQGTLTWYDNVAATGTPLPITTLLEDGKNYYATEKVGDCESDPLEFFVRIVSPQTPVGPDLICASPGNTINDIANNFSVTASETLIWYDASNVEISTDTELQNGNYSVASTIQNSVCFSDAIPFTVNIITDPEASNTTFNFCGKDNATLETLNANIDNITNKNNLVWYDIAVGGTALSITTALITNTYYVAEKVGDCESNRFPFDITVVSPETPVYNGNSPVCVAQNLTLQNLESNITFNSAFELVWYDVAENGTEIINTTTLTNNTYYIATIDRASNCESERVEIIVNIISTATTTNENPIFCNSDNPTIADLDVVASNGGDLIWYDRITGGDVLESDTPLTNNTSYFVIEQNGACGSITRLRVNVTIISPLTPLFEGDTDLCALSEPTILTLEEQIDFDNSIYEIVWYDAEDNGNELSSSNALEEEVSYYTRLRDIITGCESEAIEISVTLSNCDPEEFDFFIPDGFSPNNDSTNDTYYIPNIQYFYPNYDFEIFNRYGQSMFKGNSNNPAWDGTNNGSQVETTTGVYYYIINYNRDSLKPEQGRLYLSK